MELADDTPRNPKIHRDYVVVGRLSLSIPKLSAADFTVMSSLNQPKKTQFKKSENKSSKPKSRSRSRSRSKTPNKERMNSVQKRSVKNTQHVGENRRSRPTLHMADLYSDSKRKDIQALVDKKTLYDKKLTAIIQTNTLIQCKHNYLIGGTKPNEPDFYGTKCTKCGIDFNKIDEKAVMVQPTDDLKTLYEMVCKEFKMARDTIRSGLGNKPIRINLVSDMYISTLVTTGVTRNIVLGGVGAQINPTNTSEWNSCAAMFDEVKVIGGRCQFQYNNPSAVPNALVVNQADGMPGIAYDIGVVNAVNVKNIAEHAQHKILPNALITSGSVIQQTNTGMHEFHYKVPPGTGFNPSSGASVANYGSEWVQIDGVTTGQAWGCLMFYHIGTVITAINTGYGLNYLHCEFRCRT